MGCAFPRSWLQHVMPPTASQQQKAALFCVQHSSTPAAPHLCTQQLPCKLLIGAAVWCRACSSPSPPHPTLQQMSILTTHMCIHLDERLSRGVLQRC
jgi:hypothetical protein